MRLLDHISSEERALRIHRYLEFKGIDTKLEPKSNSDWGSEEYGDVHYVLWVVDEDSFDKAKELYEAFLRDPEAKEFQKKKAPKKELPPSPKVIPLYQNMSKNLRQRRVSAPATLTLYLIGTCILLFFVSVFSDTGEKIRLGSSSPPTISPVVRTLLINDPAPAYLGREMEPLQWGEEEKTNPLMRKQVEALIHKHLSMPAWGGLYDRILIKSKNPDAPLFNAPLFTNVREGEVWRLFTPALLHGNLLHLLFNMLWLWMLGSQIEGRIGPWRMTLLVLVTGVSSNVAQYLMSGPFFLGFSGALCGMLAFIRVRQIKAPWEGYPMQYSAFQMLTSFIFIMALIQTLAFTSSLFLNTSFSLPLANTAHIAGFATGYLLGQLDIFDAHL